MVEGGEDGREKARKKKEKKIFTKKIRIFKKKSLTRSKFVKHTYYA